MRAPFQILALPYRIKDGVPMYCIFSRADSRQWQFIAGGGEDDETPLEAARREISEECGIFSNSIFKLTSLSYLPVTVIKQSVRAHWDKHMYVIPEYAFAFKCNEDIKLSEEHTTVNWVTYEQACDKLTWDSNKTALYELNCRLTEIL